jgi:protein phosphatase
MATLSLQIAADTHKGMRRSGNEDTYGIFDVPGCDAAFVVCDGMGGLQAGDIAANESVRVIEQCLKEKLADPAADPARVLDQALRAANDAVNGLARPKLPGDDEPTVGSEPAPSNALMGTTVVAGIVRRNTLWLAHAGDSRGYLLREGKFTRLTNDHSFVDEQVRAGNMTDAEARSSRFRNMITRAIGIDTQLEPELRQETLLRGDTVLICSDGLTTMLDDSEIEALLDSPKGLERRVQELIDTANRKGGYDNTTVLLLQLGAPGEASKRPVEQRGGGIPAPEGSPERRRRRSKQRGPSPIMLMLTILGALAFLGMLLLAFSPSLRTSLGERLGRPPVPDDVAVGGRLQDYTKLTYDTTPKRIVDSPLARRTQLSLGVDGEVAFQRNSGEQVVTVMPGRLEKVVIDKLKVPDTQQADSDSPDNECYVAHDPQGNLYISRSDAGIILKLSREGKELLRIPNLYRPGALCIEPKTGDIYYIDGTYHVLALRAIHNAPPKGTKAAPK